MHEPMHACTLMHAKREREERGKKMNTKQTPKANSETVIFFLSSCTDFQGICTVTNNKNTADLLSLNALLFKAKTG